jgi:hypothetical protein
MNTDIQAVLQSLGIESVVLEDEVYGSSIASAEEDSHKFPLVFFQWTAENEQSYIRLIIIPFVDRPEEGFPFDVFGWVLSANEQLPQAKFLLDSDGDLGLALDIPAEQWSSENLERALEVLGPFADYYYTELVSFI